MATLDFASLDNQLNQFQEIIQNLYDYLDRFHILDYAIDEYLIQEELLGDEMYYTVLIRQSTFFESYLATFSQVKIEMELKDELSNRETNYLERLPPKTKVFLAYWLQVISKEDRNALLELMSIRGEIAHTPWLAIEEGDEDAERIAERIHQLLGEELPFDDP